MSYISQRFNKDKSNLLFFLISLLLHVIFILILTILTAPTPLERRSVPFNPLYLVKMDLLPLYEEDHIVKPLKGSQDNFFLRPAISPEIRSSVKLSPGKSFPKKTGKWIKRIRPAVESEPARKFSTLSKIKVAKHTRASRNLETEPIEKLPKLFEKPKSHRKTDSSKMERAKKLVLDKLSDKKPLKKVKATRTGNPGKIQPFARVSKEISLSPNTYKKSREETLPRSKYDKHHPASLPITGQYLVASKVFVPEKNRIPVHFKPVSAKKAKVLTSSAPKTPSLTIFPELETGLPRDTPKQTATLTTNKPTKRPTGHLKTALSFTITEKAGQAPSPSQEAKKSSLVENRAIKKKSRESYNLSGMSAENRPAPANIIKKAVVKPPPKTKPVTKKDFQKFAFTASFRKRKRFTQERFSSRKISLSQTSGGGKKDKSPSEVDLSFSERLSQSSVSRSDLGPNITAVWQPTAAEARKRGVVASAFKKTDRIKSDKMIVGEMGRVSVIKIHEVGDKEIKLSTGQHHKVQSISFPGEGKILKKKPAFHGFASLERRTGRVEVSSTVPTVFTEESDSASTGLISGSAPAQGKDPFPIHFSPRKESKKTGPPAGIPLKSVNLKPTPHQFLSSKPQKNKPAPTSRSDKKTTLQLAMRSNLKSRLKSFKKSIDYQHIFTKSPRRREVWIAYLNNQLSQVGFIYSLAMDHNGHLWITSDSGITEFDGRRYRHFNKDNGLPAERVYAVAVAHDNTRWFGCDQGLLADKGKGIEMVAGTGDLHVFDIKPEGDRLWLATDSGLFSYRTDRKKMTFHPHPEEGLIAYSLAVLPGEGVLVGTDRGLYRYRKNKWRLCLATDHPVDTVAVDSRKRLWYGTESGGGRFDGKKWVKLGLPGRSGSKTIYKLVGSPEGGVWMGTDRGVGYFLGRTWKLYGREHGLVGKEVYAMASGGKGQWWFATDKGLTKLTINY